MLFATAKALLLDHFEQVVFQTIEWENIQNHSHVRKLDSVDLYCLLWIFNIERFIILYVKGNESKLGMDCIQLLFYK